METIRLYLDAFIAMFGDRPYLQAAAIALLAYLLSRIITRYLASGLTRIADRLNSPLEKEFIEMAHGALFYTLFLNGLGFAVRQLPIDGELEGTILAGLKSVMIVVWAILLIGITKKLLRLAANQKESFKAIQLTTLPLFENIGMVLIALGAIHQIFSAWDVDMTALLASAGIAGLILGMAAKDVLSDVFSGILILADAPYKIGDFIVLDNEARGTVTDIGIRSTRILTRDNVMIAIPNSLMGSSKIINESGGPEQSYRVRVEICVAYGADIQRIKQIMLGVAKQCKEVCETPEAKVRMWQLGALGPQLRLLCWIENPLRRPQAISALNEGLYQRFLEENIEFAVNDQRDLYIKEMPHTHQEISIKELPVGRQVVHVKEIPQLFGGS